MHEDRLSQVCQLQARGDLAGAVGLCRQIVAQSPQDARVVHVMGLLHHQLGEHARAVELIGRSIELSPRVAEFHSNLAAVLGAMGCHAQAATALERAIQLNSRQPVAHYNLGMALEQLGRLAEAQAAYGRALRLKPDYADAWAGLGDVLRKMGPLDRAEGAYRRAVEINPKLAGVQHDLAQVHFLLGRLDESLARLRIYTELAPQDYHAHSGLLYRLHYLPKISPRQIFQEHLAWAQRHAEPLRATWREHENDRSPDRRLRIGYISADFREHTRIRFVEPVLAHHDRKNFEIFCYSDVRRPDTISVRIQSMADTWRTVTELSDDQLAQQIRRDQIDILVELTGHMANHRLLVFARKPAPLQVAWPGYPDTTGVAGIAHLITDAGRVPMDVESLYTEKLIRMDITSQCYQPTDVDLAVAPPPVDQKGYITFGSLNNPMKFNSEVVRAWAEILRAMPASRLLLLAIGGSARRTMQLFADYQIDTNRIEFVQRLPRRSYLALHGRIDIGLDPWPYNGHTTILDGLWMGVPAIALEGTTQVSREGSTALRLLGLDDLIAHTVEQYTEIAIGLAKCPARVAKLRSILRERMEASPLRDGPGLTRRLEVVFRDLWRQWCIGTRMMSR